MSQGRILHQTTPVTQANPAQTEQLLCAAPPSVVISHGNKGNNDNIIWINARLLWIAAKNGDIFYSSPAIHMKLPGRARTDSP